MLHLPLRAVQNVARDLRLGLRGLWQHKTFAATAILSIALGIGANTAIFSLIHALMLRPLPARAPHELVELRNHYPDPAEPKLTVFLSSKYYELFRARRDVFAEIGGIALLRAQVGGEGFEPEPVDGLMVTDQFFPMLDIQPAIGRMIGPSDSQPGPVTSSVAVLSWSYWQRRFNRDPSVLGKTISVNGNPAVIVGVAPRGLTGISPGLRTDLWMPTVGNPAVAVIGRLRPGVSHQQAEVQLSGVNRQRVEEMAQQSNDPLWRQATLEVWSAAAGISVLREQYGRPLLVLMAIVALLLGIACTNIASILLARGASRQHEIALRLALGASRLRVVQHVLTEALLIAAIGGAAGVVIAYLGANGLVELLISGAARLPMALDLQVQLNLPLLLFTASVAILTGLFFGLAPAWQAFSFAPLSTMQEIRSRGESRSHRLFGASVIVAQVALSAVLLSGAALFARHVSDLRNTDLGFERRSVLLVSTSPPEGDQNRADRFVLYRDLLARFAAIPGVQSATISAVTPIEGPSANRFVHVEGFEEPASARRYVLLNWVGPKYFETFGTARMAGRDFRFEDQGQTPVAIVNEATARYYFGNTSAIGRAFTFDGENRRYEVVGVVADAKYTDLRQPAPRTIYLNYFQSGPQPLQWAVRTAVAPMAVSGGVQRIVRDVSPAMRVTKVTTLADQMDRSIVTERIVATLAGLFGAAGAALVAIGLFGLLAYMVTRRTREIGVRMALGATAGDVARMVLRRALGLVGCGLAIGLPLALAGQRFARNLVEGLPADSSIQLVIAAVATVVLALVAAYLPARRAAGVRPVQALRHE